MKELKVKEKDLSFKQKELERREKMLEEREKELHHHRNSGDLSRVRTGLLGRFCVRNSLTFWCF